MSNPHWDDGDDDNNNEEKEGSEKYSDWGGRDGMVFLIDATEPMFVKSKDDKIPFVTCIECCKTTMLNKIIGCTKDLVGVVLFGTKKSDDPNMKHITVLQSFSQPSAEKIKHLEKLTQLDSLKEFVEEYGHSKDFSLSDALWQAQRLFSNCTLKLATRCIFLFTCTDNPHANDQDQQRRALERARNLNQDDIDLELIHMGKKFNPALFYQELVQESLGENSSDFALPNPTTRLEELLTRVSRQNFKKRSLSRLIFKLGNGVELSVSIYNLLGRPPPPKRQWLDRKDNEILHSVRQIYDANTGDMMLPVELTKFQEYGGERIVFQPEEVKNVRQMIDQGIFLMGFKPENRVKLHHHYKSSGFVYPDDSKIKGSSQLFAALLDRCIALKVVPICWISARLNSPPQLIALVPQLEQLNDSKIQILPPGFHVVFLPYADNIRPLEVVEIREQLTHEQLNLMKKIVTRLRFNFSPMSFDNPKMQTLWSSIEALAMERAPREITDYTRPDYRIMNKMLGPLTEQFKNMFYPEGFEPVDTVRGKASGKRVASVPSSSGGKVVKTENMDMKDIALQGKVEKCKVEDLKNYLMAENIKVSGMKKSDLVAMVYKHLDISPPK